MRPGRPPEPVALPRHRGHSLGESICGDRPRLRSPRAVGRDTRPGRPRRSAAWSVRPVGPQTRSTAQGACPDRPPKLVGCPGHSPELVARARCGPVGSAPRAIVRAICPSRSTAQGICPDHPPEPPAQGACPDRPPEMVDCPGRLPGSFAGAGQLPRALARTGCSGTLWPSRFGSQSDRPAHSPEPVDRPGHLPGPPARTARPADQPPGPAPNPTPLRPAPPPRTGRQPRNPV